MAVDPNADGFSLRRWSQRKLAAARATSAPDPQPAPPVVAAEPAATAAPVPATNATPAAGAATPAAAGKVPLPPIESLSLDSDFTPFLRPEVDDTLRRQALKALFRQPAFNVMDGLDVYIDDYGKPDPIAPEIVRQLVQGRYLFDPPATRVNVQGAVEDVPVVAAGDAVPAAGTREASAPAAGADRDSAAELPAPSPAPAEAAAAPDAAEPKP